MDLTEIPLAEVVVVKAALNGFASSSQNHVDSYVRRYPTHLTPSYPHTHQAKRACPRSGVLLVFIMLYQGYFPLKDPPLEHPNSWHISTAPTTS